MVYQSMEDKAKAALAAAIGLRQALMAKVEHHYLQEKREYEVKNWNQRFEDFTTYTRRWYVGITNDTARRGVEHKIPANHHFYYVNAGTQAIARATEQQLGMWMQGGNTLGGALWTSWFVYIYKIVPGVTDENA